MASNSRSGFSLIIVAVLLVLASAFILTLILPNTWTNLDKVDTTKKKLDKINSAITAYFNLQQSIGGTGFYPCPASLTAKISDTSPANFGLALPTASPTACSTTSTCTSLPDVGIKCPTSNAGSVGRTWIGAVPVRTLGLPDNYEFDEWGNRFTYAVNNSSKFNINTISGGTYKTENYNVVSHGPDGIGAYNINGILTTCSRASAGATTSELENCDITANDNFIYNNGWSKDNATFYDDLSVRF